MQAAQGASTSHHIQPAPGHPVLHETPGPAPGLGMQTGPGVGIEHMLPISSWTGSGIAHDRGPGSGCMWCPKSTLSAA